MSQPLRHVACTCSVAILEKARLRGHFREVIAELAARDVSHLTDLQRARRAALLVELGRYASTGRFPKNRDFPAQLVPYFVDAVGTRCAVAHLVEATGDTELVSEITTHQNPARIRELEGDPALQAWLDRAGLTAAEAARIQPSYCFITKADACVCNHAYAATGVVEATLVTEPWSSRAMVRIDAVHGNAGSAMVGAELEIQTYFPNQAQPGDRLLVPVEMSSPSTMGYGQAFIVLPDGEVELAPCGNGVPALAKEDAIAALLETNAIDGQAACAASLASVDPVWDDSQCEDGGCATAGDASPFAIGTALLVAALGRRRSSRV